MAFTVSRLYMVDGVETIIQMTGTATAQEALDKVEAGAKAVGAAPQALSFSGLPPKGKPGRPRKEVPPEDDTILVTDAQMRVFSPVDFPAWEAAGKPDMKTWERMKKEPELPLAAPEPPLASAFPEPPKKAEILDTPPVKFEPAKVEIIPPPAPAKAPIPTPPSMSPVDKLRFEIESEDEAIRKLVKSKYPAWLSNVESSLDPLVKKLEGVDEATLQQRLGTVKNYHEEVKKALLSV